MAATGQTDEVTLTAERLLHDGAADRTLAEGRAHLDTDGAAIDAERIVYEQQTGVITAVGHVVARFAQRGAPMAVLADLVTLRLEGTQVVEISVLDGVAVMKREANVTKLLAATTKAELDAAGPTTMLLNGNHFERVDDGWRLGHLELVPCECNFDSPSWSVRTDNAVLNADADRVSVTWPSMWVKKVPLVKELPVPLTVPWLSLPLTDRATGLLFPKPAGTVLNGFSFEQPIFVTLGRSADLTLTPGFFFGGAQFLNDGALFAREAARARGLDVIPDPTRPSLVAPRWNQPFGIQGPRLLSELRYVLSDRAQGKVNLGLLYDLRQRRDPGNAGLVIDSARGLRGEAAVFHTQDFGNGFGTRVELAAHSDGFYQRDVTPDVIASQAGYLRSTAVLFNRGPNHLLTLDAVLRQDITSGYDLFGRDVFPSGSLSPRNGPNPMQRLPALTFALPTRTLMGPLAFDFTADAVQQMPLRFGTGDEGALANEGRPFDGFTGEELRAECVSERVYLARPPSQFPGCPLTTSQLKVGLGDGRWQRGEREARFRLNAIPRLQLAGLLAGGVSLSASAAWRQGVWFGQASGNTVTRGYPLLTARAELEAARVFDGTIRHALTPLLELRAVPWVLATSGRRFDAALLGGPATYDEIDRSISDNRPRVQAVAELRQRLVQRGGRELLRLDLGQGFDLLSPVTPGPGGTLAVENTASNAPRLAESYARLGLSLWWFTGAAQARFEPLWRPSADVGFGPRLTRLSTSLSFDIPGGYGISAGYENVLDDGTNRARAPIDLLFGDPVVPTATSRAQLILGGVRARFGPLALRYDVIVVNRPWPRLGADGKQVIDPVSGPLSDVLLSLGQHTVAASWAPACDCWRVDVSVTQRLTLDGLLSGPEFGFNFTVSRLGSISAGP